MLIRLHLTLKRADAFIALLKSFMFLESLSVSIGVSRRLRALFGPFCFLKLRAFVLLGVAF